MLHLNIYVHVLYKHLFICTSWYLRNAYFHKHVHHMYLFLYIDMFIKACFIYIGVQ